MSFFSLFWTPTRGEVYTSLSKMKGLVRLESVLSQSLDRYLQERSEAPSIIQNFADHVRKESVIASIDVEKYLWHPINCFQLVRRFTKHWKELDLYLSNGEPNG